MKKEVDLETSEHWVPARTAIQTFRDSAIAELVDNAIEADATDIQILSFEKEELVRERVTKRIDRIAVVDNGVGMNGDVLQLCLQFGMGTRLRSRKGIGRFGIGLPNASVSQCKRVDVYSWQGGATLHTYLDVDEVAAGGSETRNPVTEGDVPAEILKQLERKAGKSGTAVVWSKCDRLDLARTSTLYRRMERNLCRVYRHFLDDDDSYGKRREILLIRAGARKQRSSRALRANDPLYLMTPNSVPGHEHEATNEPFGQPVKLAMQVGNTSSVVEVRFSIAKPSVQRIGGGSKLGQHYGDNTGISLVRAGREIDFGTFGFFNPRDERQRWWGCEVRFEPLLDEVFGVTNNKQSARGFYYFDEQEFKKEHPEDWQDELEGDVRLQVMGELSRAIYLNISEMKKIIDKRGSGTRSKKGPEDFVDKSTKVANDFVSRTQNPSRSRAEAGRKTDEEKRAEWEQQAEKHEGFSTEEREQFVEQNLPLEIAKEFESWPGSQFFSPRTIGNTWTVVVNVQHPFYTDLYERMMEDEDPRRAQALDLLILAFAQMENELYSRIEDLEEMRETWGRYVKALLMNLRKDA